MVIMLGVKNEAHQLRASFSRLSRISYLISFAFVSFLKRLVFAIQYHLKVGNAPDRGINVIIKPH